MILNMNIHNSVLSLIDIYLVSRLPTPQMPEDYHLLASTTPAIQRKSLSITRWKWRTSQQRAMRKLRLLILFQFHQNHSQKKLRISHEMLLKRWTLVTMHEGPMQPQQRVLNLLDLAPSRLTPKLTPRLALRVTYRVALRPTITGPSSSSSSQCVLVHPRPFMSVQTKKPKLYVIMCAYITLKLK